MAPSQHIKGDADKCNTNLSTTDNDLKPEIVEDAKLPLSFRETSFSSYGSAKNDEDIQSKPVLSDPVNVKIAEFKVSDLQNEYPFFFSRGDDESYFSEYESTISLSSTGSADFLLNKNENRRTFMDLSQSLPHVRSDDRKATNFLTSMNVFCLIQGVSIFAMPFVTVYSFVPVIFLSLFLGIVNWYTAYLLVECQHQISESRPGVRKRVYPTFIDIGKAAFKTHGELIMKIITITIVVSGISYFILLGQITFDTLHSKLPLTTQHWIIVWALFLFPSLFIDRVSVMSWFSMVSTVSLTMVVFIISGVLVSNYHSWKVENIRWGFDMEYFFLAYGIIQNSFFVHLVVPAIEGSMRKPESCHKVMGMSFTINTSFKIFFQAMAALTFGTDIQQSVTSNINSPVSIAFLINVLTALNLYCGFPIILCVLFEMLDDYVLPSFTVFHKKSRGRSRAWRALSRLLIVVFVVFISVSIPEFGLVVSFLGNLRSTIAAMILPTLFFIKLRWRQAGTVNRIAAISLLIIAVVMGVGACFFSMRSIINSFKT